MNRWRVGLGAFVLALAYAVLLVASAIARDPEPLPQPSRVTAGSTHTCADWWYGSSCWGDNDEGKLGNGTASGVLLAPIALPKIVPEAVLGPRTETAGRPFASLDAGPTVTCALATGMAGTAAGEVWCWGGQEGTGLGRVCGGEGLGSSFAPGAVWKGPPGDDEGPHRCGAAPLASVFSVAVAEHRTCSLVGSPWDETGGEVWCWDSQGGQAELLAHPMPGPDGDTMAGVKVLDGAFGGFCAVTIVGEVWCWGDLGSSPPTRVAGVTDAVAVAVGGEHACAQLRDGSVWCWGQNERGQLGDGTTTPAASAVRVEGLDETSPAKPGERADTFIRGRRVLSAGQAHTCVLRDEHNDDYEYRFEQSHAVFCWGANDRGQLGDGSHDDRSDPVLVRDLDPASGVFDLALGRSHSCTVTGETASVSHADPTIGGIVASRLLRCWGANDHGQLGTGDRDSRTRPTVVVMTEEPWLAERPS